MSSFGDVLKRVVVGRPMRSDKLGHTLLPKRIALPVFASDALSSVAYAPDEILLTLAIAGAASVAVSPWVGLAVAVVMVTVVASYRQNVHAYPSGGGDYEVATTNLGKRAGLVVASALLVDYVMTVAVSISSGAAYIIAAVPALRGHEVALAVGLVTFIALMNLRGMRESGTVFAIPTYLYMLAVGLMALFGAVQYFSGTLQPAASAAFEILPDDAYAQGLNGLAGAFLVLRAFSSGSAALTGVEAISNGVPSFRKPKSKNAATTLVLLGSISVLMLMSVLLLAMATGVHFVEHPTTNLLLDGQPVGDSYHQDPVIGQIAATVFSGLPILFYFTTVVTGLILVLAANTAFNGFPVLTSILARDEFFPRQLSARGDRLVYSNGILMLAAASIAMIVAFGADVTRLIQLYVVGVFISFTTSQLGMIRHWSRNLRTTTDRTARNRMLRSRAVNTLGFAMTGTVLLVVLATKTIHGAWIALLLMGMLYLLMLGIHTHYERLGEELAVADPMESRALPARTHGIVLLQRLNKPTLRAIGFARAARPNTLEALHISLDPESAAELRAEWEDLEIPVPLTIVASPYREMMRPVVEYIRSIRRSSPRDLVVVYIPEFVVEHWWEKFLHNRVLDRLKASLRHMPGVVMASVPWQLGTHDQLEVPGTFAVEEQRRIHAD